MTEERSPSPSADSKSASATTGNQNLIIGLVLGAVVLLLFLLVLQMTGGGFGGQSEVEKLKAERDARKEALSKVGTPGGSPGGQNAQALATRLSTDSATLADLVAKMQSMLANSEQSLKQANALNQGLTQQLNNSTGLANENANLKAQLAQSQNRATRAEATLSSLQQQLNNAHTRADMELVRAQLDKAVQERDSFRGQAEALRKQLQGTESAEIAKSLREERDKLRAEVAKYKTESNDHFYEIQKLRAELDLARLYVEAEALPAKAKLLYDELSKLEAATPAELAGAYKRIEADLGATVVDKIPFPTGSSNVTRDDAEKINRKVQAAGNESFFLVVGYASKSGGLENNKQLSAQRATRIASVTNTLKKSEQAVNAVFLSETNRFGANLPDNQVCEIWEIRK